MKDGTAKHRQIAENIRRDIETGKYQPGDRPPSQAEPVEHYRVAQTTVRQTMSPPDKRGLARCEHSQRSFVA